MLITIRVPDEAVKLQYATASEGYESWTAVTMGDIVAVEKEERT